MSLTLLADAAPIEETPFIGIYTSSALAIILILIMALGARHKLSPPKNELLFLRCIAGTILLGAINDPFLYYANGKAGGFYRFVNLVMNGVQYLVYIAISVLWVLYLVEHIYGKGSWKRYLLLTSPFLISVIGICINYFHPFIYAVSDDNFYSRSNYWGYWLYFAVSLIYLGGSLILYFVVRCRRHRLLFFPAWSFVVTLVIGAILQAVFSGLSIILSFSAASFVAIITSILYETIFVDRLTQIYNRSFLDYYLKTKSKDVMIGAMIDINDFKAINDNYGHKAGDEALVLFASVISRNVKTDGYAVRYAGDEFIIIFNFLDEEKAAKILADIREDLVKEAKSGKYAFDEISFCAGFALFDPKKDTFDSFLNEIDAKMYAEKHEFHEEHGSKAHR